MIDSPQVLFGRVMHFRKRPVRHGFAYPVFFLRIPLSQLGSLANRWMGVDRWNLFSFMTRDHGAHDGTPLEPWIRALLAKEGVRAADGEIVLQCMPRMLGYVFNPISLWYCFDREARLRAVLAEVANTFGEFHNYLVAHADGRPITAKDWLVARKVFHVSPFCEVEGHYRFRFSGDAAHQFAQIDYHDRSGKLLVTAWHGEARPLASNVMLGTFFTYPLMTLGVVARIHWQAVKLWVKRVPWFSKPIPPLTETTR